MEKHIEPHVAREQVESKAKEEKLIDRWMKIKIGSVPLPVYIVLSTVIVVTGLLQQLPVNMLGGFAVILTLGWLLGTIGATIPFIKNFGGPAILSLLVPSILVFFNLVNPNILEASQLLIFLYCLFSLRQYFRDESQNLSPRFDADDYSHDDWDDLRHGCWYASWCIIRFRMATYVVFHRYSSVSWRDR